MAFRINSDLVYDVSYLKEKQPSYFKGLTNAIKIIDKKAIPPNQYMFASYSKTRGWKKLDDNTKYRKKRLLISKEWVEQNIIAATQEEIVDKQEWINSNGKQVIIRIRGKKTPDGIRFRASDIYEALCVEWSFLNQNLESELGNTFKFIKDKHYTYMTEDGVSGEIETLYMTYHGLMRFMLVISENVEVIKFQKWVYDFLYGIAENGAANININSDLVEFESARAFLQTSVSSIPSLYLIDLGSVKDLREEFLIPDNFVDTDRVVKFGLTNDLSRRLAEHSKTYGSIVNRHGCNVSLKFHAYIDTIYLYSAEKEISDYFKNVHWNLEHDTYKELICVSEIMLNNVVHSQLKNIAYTYSNRVNDLQTQMEILKSENARQKEREEFMKEILKAKNEMIQVYKNLQ